MPPYEIDGVTYKINPKYLLGAREWQMVKLWRLHQGGMGSTGYLPEAGGSMNQACMMINCFALMDAHESKILQQRKDNYG